MKVVSWNINGYRSAQKTGYFDKLIERENPDIICLQEIKMNNELVNNYGYNCYYNLGLNRFDIEGRFILLKSVDKRIIICTDFNIAHTELDVEIYKTNYKNNMFLLKREK